MVWELAGSGTDTGCVQVLTASGRFAIYRVHGRLAIPYQTASDERTVRNRHSPAFGPAW